MIEACITLAFIMIMFLFFVTFIWIIDVYVTKGDSYKYGWASYRTFRREYSKYDWKLTYEMLTTSLTSESGNNRISSITYSANFSGVDMIINNPIGYIFTKLFIWKEFKRFNKREVEKVKW